MYNGTGVGAAGAATAGTVGLAYTGLNIVWLLLAAFAMIATGMAVMRIVPRREQ